MDGITRSAILMMSLGEDAAAEVFKFLSARYKDSGATVSGTDRR